jgi:hypothetical protein
LQANHANQRRVFTSTEVEGIEMSEDERNCWLAFSTEENTLPFVKVLEIGTVLVFEQNFPLETS